MSGHPTRRNSSDVAAIRDFRAILRKAGRGTHFLYGSEVTSLAFELRSALFALKARIVDPREGVKAVADFFRTDRRLFNMCDDSDGTLGDVFRVDACEVFTYFASACDDKKRLSETVFQLQLDSDYGVRDCLIDASASYLPASVIRRLADKFWELAGKEGGNGPQHWDYLIESLARQLRDPQLFERASLAAFPEGGPGQSIDIAEVYLEAGDAETALEWLNKVSLDERYLASERDELLLGVHRKLGNNKEAAEAAWRIFRRYRREETFEPLLDVIGSDKRQRVLDEEAGLILESRELDYTDVQFLLWCGKVEDAEGYVLSRSTQVDGDYYGSILPLCEEFEREGRYLAATVLYRALLESVLDRAISKYYGFGIRYLRKLDELSPLVRRWRSFMPHEAYFSDLVENHKRKSSFWRRYEAKGRKLMKDKRKDGKE